MLSSPFLLGRAAAPRLQLDEWGPMRLFADVHIVLPDVATNGRSLAIVDGRKIDRKGTIFRSVRRMVKKA
jgi:predicted protein tyrosine phosphatase